jgi:RNA polymerase sigma-70 factor, ECF subfamily
VARVAGVRLGVLAQNLALLPGAPCLLSGEARRTAPSARIPLSKAPAVAELALQVRSGTYTFQRTEVKEHVRRLREALPDTDRLLLILRVDREMSWRDLARVVLGGNPSPDELEREAVRLRKRFQLVKERLRAGLREQPRRSG